ncbi:MAG TPA: hypothetical protein VLY23_03670 [Candidatus Acidoferrum sp.]|nr:hypothetical protein [Candidatus Acidoferrum sp.]
MARITFQKRQKEMKRLEKARAKAERRAQKKLEKRPAGEGAPIEAPLNENEFEAPPQEQEPQV